MLLCSAGRDEVLSNFAETQILLTQASHSRIRVVLFLRAGSCYRCYIPSRCLPGHEGPSVTSPVSYSLSVSRQPFSQVAFNYITAIFSSVIACQLTAGLMFTCPQTIILPVWRWRMFSKSSLSAVFGLLDWNYLNSSHCTFSTDHNQEKIETESGF